MSTERDHHIVRNDEEGRFVLEDAPQDGFIEFEESDGRLRLIHTEVADEREGQGLGSALVRGALDDAERRGLTVVPECEFVAGWLDRHPERAERLDIAAA